MRTGNLWFPVILFLLSIPVLAQEEEKEEKTTSSLYRDTIPLIELERQKDAGDKEDDKKDKKKRKKKVFYGIKTKKYYTKVGGPRRTEIEQFYYLKKFKKPNEYVPEIYVYNIEERIVESLKDFPRDEEERKKYKILHGPYKKMVDGNVVVKGIFYIGTKHGRWEKYAQEETEEFKEEEVSYSILLDKKKYYKGWPRDSKISYYDASHTKIKEVIPYRRDIPEGDYYYFTEKGNIQKTGQYENGKKVGRWVEYFPDSRQKKKEIQYPKDPYDDTEPYVINEWNEKHQLIVKNGEKVEPGEEKKVDYLKERYNKKRN